MSKTIQVRNVPDEVHHKLKVRAAEQRVSLSDLILDELEQIASRPTMKEMIKRFESLEPVNLDRPVAELIAEGHRERDARIAASLSINKDHPVDGG